MSQIQRMIQLFATTPLTDVVIAGFTLGPGLKRFYPRLMDVYLIFGDSILRCSSIGQYDRLKLDFVADYDLSFGIPEDGEYCLSSVAELCLRFPYSKRFVTSLYLIVEADDLMEEGVVKCAGFNLYGDDFLFMDPTHVFGIQVGDLKSLDRWLRDNRQSDGRFRGYVWRFGKETLESSPLEQMRTPL